MNDVANAHVSSAAISVSSAARKLRFLAHVLRTIATASASYACKQAICRYLLRHCSLPRARFS